MDKSRSRKQIEETNKPFLIKTKRVWWNEGIVMIFTSVLWLYCLMVIFFFVEPLLPIETGYGKGFRAAFQLTRMDIRGFLLSVAVIFVLIYSGLYLWSVYNKRRFGKLSRRSYPSMTTKEDLLALDMIDEEVYNRLQNSKSITLKTNPVRIVDQAGKTRTQEKAAPVMETQDS